jgi:hypothetical protein
VKNFNPQSDGQIRNEMRRHGARHKKMRHLSAENNSQPDRFDENSALFLRLRILINDQSAWLR